MGTRARVESLQDDLLRIGHGMLNPCIPARHHTIELVLNREYFNLSDVPRWCLRFVDTVQWLIQAYLETRGPEIPLASSATTRLLH